MSLTSTDLAKMLEAIGTKQLDHYAALQREVQKANQEQINDLKTFLKESIKPLTNLKPTVHPKLAEPPIFSGQNNADFLCWIKQFRAVAQLNHWSDEMCALLLHTCLKDPALNYFQSLAPEVQNNFDTAIEALSLRFNDTILQASLHAELKNCKQSPTESVSEFTNILEKFFSRLDVEDEFYKLLIFLGGLHPHLQFEVRKQGPITYSKAKEIARVIEAAFKKQSPSYTSSMSVVPTNAELMERLSQFSKKIASLETNLSNFQKRRNHPAISRSHVKKSSRGHNRTSDGRPICYNCRKPGHLVRTCLATLTSSGFNSSLHGSTQSSHSQNQQNSIVTMFTDVSESNFSIFGSISSKPFDFLIDTGSTITAVSYKTWLQIPHSHNHFNSSTSLNVHSASRTPLRMHGSFRCQFQINGVSYPFPTYVIYDLSHPVILGSDFLAAYALSIDFRTLRLQLHNSTQPSPDLPQCNLKMNSGESLFRLLIPLHPVHH